MKEPETLNKKPFLFRHDIYSNISTPMMSFQQYQLLTPSLQAEILWLNGVYLELIRHTTKLNIELYSLFHFYVEIYFDKSTEEPLFLKAFEDTGKLEPYLELVDIDSMFQTG